STNPIGKAEAVPLTSVIHGSLIFRTVNHEVLHSIPLINSQPSLVLRREEEPVILIVKVRPSNNLEALVSQNVDSVVRTVRDLRSTQNLVGAVFQPVRNQQDSRLDRRENTNVIRSAAHSNKRSEEHTSEL